MVMVLRGISAGDRFNNKKKGDNSFRPLFFISLLKNAFYIVNFHEIAENAIWKNWLKLFFLIFI
jgi:hypothetical protein